MEDEPIVVITPHRRVKQRDLMNRLVKIVDATINQHDEYGEYIVAYYVEGESLSSFVVAGKQPMNRVKQLLRRNLFPVTARFRMIENPYDNTRKMWRMSVIEHHNEGTNNGTDEKA